MGEAGKDAEVPRAVRKMQDGRSWGGMLLAGIPPPASPSQNWNRHDENQGLFVLPELAWRGEGTGVVRISLSIHFLSVFPGEELTCFISKAIARVRCRGAALSAVEVTACSPAELTTNTWKP